MNNFAEYKIDEQSERNWKTKWKKNKKKSKYLKYTEKNEWKKYKPERNGEKERKQEIVQ